MKLWWHKFKKCLHIEKGGDEQLKDELIAYNPLVPNGKELTATLMFEIDNPLSRGAFLGKVGGIEEKIFMKIDNEKVESCSRKKMWIEHQQKEKLLRYNLFILNLTMIKSINLNQATKVLNLELIIKNMLILQN